MMYSTVQVVTRDDLECRRAYGPGGAVANILSLLPYDGDWNPFNPRREVGGFQSLYSLACGAYHRSLINRITCFPRIPNRTSTLP